MAFWLFIFGLYLLVDDHPIIGITLIVTAFGGCGPL